MLDDVGAVTTVSDCDGCAVAEASAMAQGCLVQCACKRMYGPDDATWPREERPSHVALAAPMVRELARAVADVAEVRRWERAELARYAGGGPAPPSCPIARLMAEASGAAADATPAQVERMRAFLATGTSRTAAEVRRGFVARLVERMARDLPREEPPPVDAARAARSAARLEALAVEHRRVLAALSHAGEGCGWERAVGVVVDEVLPRPAVRTYGAAGRPGADRTRVPDDVRRRAEAERLLRAALGAWEDGR